MQSLFLHANGIIHSDLVRKTTYNLIFRPKVDVRGKLAQLTRGDGEGLLALQQSIMIEDYETVFTGSSEADFNDPTFYVRTAGDFVPTPLAFNS